MLTKAAIERMTREEFLQFQSNVEKVVKQGSAAQKKAALEAQRLIEDLDDVSRIKIAFRGTKILVRERKMFEAIDQAPGAGAAKLTQSMGWKSQAWDQQFGLMAQTRLAPLVPPALIPDSGTEAELLLFFTSLLADRDEMTGGYSLHAPVRDALMESGVLGERVQEAA